MRAEASAFVDAPPERVWRMLSDVTRMGEWSPICRRCEWLGGADTPKVGARFKGHNRQGLVRWTTVCEVTESEPGKVFSFRTIDGTFAFGARGKEQTRWRYTFEPEEIGTRVTESYEVVSEPPLVRIPEVFVSMLPFGKRVLAARARAQETGMRTTLERLKKAAEGL